MYSNSEVIYMVEDPALVQVLNYFSVSVHK